MNNFFIVSQYCYDYVINQIPMGLLFYAHIPAAILALLFGAYLLFKDRTEVSISFFVVCLSFSIWSILNLLTWFVFLGERSVMFTWSLIDLFTIIFFTYSYFFLYAFINKKIAPFYQKLIGLLLILPTAIATFLGKNLIAYEANTCEAIENSAVTMYPLFLQAIIIIAVIVLIVNSYRKTTDKKRKKEILLAGTGVLLFLTFFFSALLSTALLASYDIVQYAYNYEIYGIFGMPVLLGLLMFLAVRYKSFNIKIFATQALVWVLWISVGSMLLIAETYVMKIIISITEIITIIFGLQLIKSVKKEIEQREYLEKDTKELYLKNLEVVIRNKTMALLEKLYKTGVLALTPEEMAKKISEIVRQDLNFEFVGILILNKEANLLSPLAFSYSKRLTENLKKNNFSFDNIKIKNVSHRDFFEDYAVDFYITKNLKDIWSGLIDSEKLEIIGRESNIKAIVIYSLKINNKLNGSLIFGLNRDYNNLSLFEKESINNLISITSLLLNRAYIYKDLQVAYEIEKKAKLELKRLDIIKNQFVQSTQHDLRTPLTSIMGYTDLMLSGTFGKQTKKTEEVLQKIQIVTQNMIRKVNDFLDVTQFELGKNPVLLKPGVELVPIIEETVKELNFAAEKKEVTLKFERPKENFIILADKEKLKAAIFNVVDNSIKYSPKGVVSIKAQNGNKIKIIIKDTGIGMNSVQIKTLFDRIFERDEKAKETAEGKGIGLYLAAQIIKYHNGRIWAESEGEGKGSTFYIELPKS